MFSTGWDYTYQNIVYKNNGGISGDKIVDNYFRHSLNHTVICSSTAVIQKRILIQAGGFPDGMISGEDLYTWAKIASICKFAYTDKALAHYDIDSGDTFKRKRRIDNSIYRYSDLIDNTDPYKYEYLAMLAYRKAITYLINGNLNDALNQIELFKGNKLSERMNRKFSTYKIFPPFMLRCYFNIGIYIKKIYRRCLR